LIAAKAGQGGGCNQCFFYPPDHVIGWQGWKKGYIGLEKTQPQACAAKNYRPAVLWEEQESPKFKP